MATGSYLSIITLNVNGFNAPTKRQSVEWIQKQEEDITIINIYALNIGASQYVRQMLTSIKGFFYVDDHVICK